MRASISTTAALAAAGLAVGGYCYAAMWPESQLFGKAILGGSDPNEIALTFDDGPNAACTGRLLEILAIHRVLATFFMMGSYVRQRPDLARAIRDAGHVIGNHTVTHPKLLYCSPRRVREELAGCNAILEDTLGQPVRYFRPPFGARRPDVLRTARDLGLVPVLWNAPSLDWRDGTPQQILARVDAAVERNRRRGTGSNVLLHDGGHRAMGFDRSRTLRAVEMLLERERNGTRFVTVEALGRDSRAERG